MTREEAKKVLEEMIKYEWSTYQTKTAKIYVNALDMAIKALEQEPCDAISRQAVLNAIMENSIWENEYNLTSSRIKKAVEDLPLVNPQPKSAHWYRKHSWEICFTCSNCETTNASGTKYNYCPSCGSYNGGD